ncbi:MAG: tetratricopeptide repeat protein [Magnetovibrionaceae bacterium]
MFRFVVLFLISLTLAQVHFVLVNPVLAQFDPTDGLEIPDGEGEVETAPVIEPVLLDPGLPETDPAHDAFVNGVEAFKVRDYDQAFDDWFPIAEEGVAAAGHNLAVLFELGLGVEKDPEAAAFWYRMAALEGEIPDAMTNLGFLYARGMGVALDHGQAAHWFQRAADQDFAQGQYNLAIAYLQGKGIRRDEVKAFGWMRAAAEQGYRPAQYNLAGLYLQGRGVEADAAQAFDWFARAARQGDRFARFNQGLMLYRGQGTTKDLEAAAGHIREAAEAGVVPAQNLLGALYANGEGLPRDLDQALYWLQVAAGLGNEEALTNLDRLKSHVGDERMARAARRAQDFQPKDVPHAWPGRRFVNNQVTEGDELFDLPPDVEDP